MHYAETRGLAAIAAGLQAMQARGLAQSPSPRLVRAAAEGRFASIEVGAR
jgi:hypothetical protein